MRLYLYTQSKVFKQASWSLGVAVGLGLSALRGQKNQTSNVRRN